MHSKIGVAPMSLIVFPQITKPPTMSPEVIKLNAAIMHAQACGFTHYAKALRVMLAKELRR
jgi:hypothetical protein